MSLKDLQNDIGKITISEFDYFLTDKGIVNKPLLIKLLCSESFINIYPKIFASNYKIETYIKNGRLTEPDKVKAEGNVRYWGDVYREIDFHIIIKAHHQMRDTIYFWMESKYYAQTLLIQKEIFTAYVEPPEKVLCDFLNKKLLNELFTGELF